MLMLSPQVTVGDGEVPGGKSSKVCSSNASFLEQRLVDWEGREMMLTERELMPSPLCVRQE